MQLSTYIRTGLTLFAAALALVPAATAGSQTTTLSQNERALLTAVNDVRASHGLRALRVDATLVRAARSYSAHMIRTGTFTHGAMGARLAQAGARGPVYGENLAWGVGASAGARTIVRSWMASPGHRANILNCGLTRLGVGVGYGGSYGITWTQLFG